MNTNPNSTPNVEELITDKILTDTRYFFFFQILMQALVAIATPNFCSLIYIPKITAAFVVIPVGILLYMLKYFFSREGTECKRYQWKGMFSLYYTKYFNVWFYILIIGMITNNSNKNYQSFNLLQNMADEHSFNYLGDMFKTFMISILAFLASNIINQMLGIKDGYDGMQKKFKESYDEMERKNSQFLNDLQKIDVIIKDTIIVNKIIAPINNLISEVRDDNTRYLERQLDLFTSNMATYTATLAKYSAEKNLRIWNLSLFNKYIESNVDSLENDRTIFIPYNELKNVVSHFMKNAMLNQKFKALDKDKKPLFYALFAAPPSTFFPNKDGIFPLKSFTYCKWNFLVGNNIIPEEEKGVNSIHRLFISVDDSCTLKELEKIKKSAVNRNLDEKAYNIIEELREDNDKSLNNLNSDIERHYHKKYGEKLKQLETSLNKNNLTFKTLLSEFHNTGCCKLLELNSNEAETILTGKNAKYIKDYFAVKTINPKTGEYDWSYCLAAAFHHDFTAIEINIYDESMKDNQTINDKNWSFIKDDLNKIFHHSSIKAI